MNYISLLLLFILPLIANCHAISAIPIPLSLLRSPITIDLGHINTPLSPEIHCRLQFASNNLRFGIDRLTSIKTAFANPPDTCSHWTSSEHILSERVDTLQDLMETETVVLVAISGGGARAASLGAQAMGYLEKRYNEITHELGLGDAAPLVRLIDGYSTVSGGSIYAFHVARTLTAVRAPTATTTETNTGIIHGTSCNSVQDSAMLRMEENTPEAERKDKRDLLIDFERSFFTLIQTHALRQGLLGPHTASWYISPGNLFAGPALIFATSTNYLDILAAGINYADLRNSSILNEYVDPDRRYGLAYLFRIGLAPSTTFPIGRLCPKPRFFFNGTSLETGLPFVFTQSVINFPQDQIQPHTVRLDLLRQLQEDHIKQNQIKPIASGYTLEEIGTAPSSFPLAYAAMGSAAFPLGIEPLKLAIYQYDQRQMSMFASSNALTISDGGIYDNSGLSTISHLVTYLRKNSQKQPRFVVIAINAEGSEYDVMFPHEAAVQEPWYRRWPPFSWLRIDWPLRYKALGYEAMNVMHFTNKRRSEVLSPPQEMKSVTYLPVHLSQLSSHDSYSIPDHEKLYLQLKQIPTTYTTTEDEDFLLGKAAKVLISSEQKEGWKIDITCSPSAPPQNLKRLDYAFALSLLQHENSGVTNEALRRSWCTYQKKAESERIELNAKKRPELPRVSQIPGKAF